MGFERYLGRTQFFFITGLLLLTGFSATTLISYFVGVSAVREAALTSELPLTSDNIYSEIQKDLILPVFISSMMATDTFLRDWVLGGEADPGPLIKYLADIQKRYSAVTTFFVSDATRRYYHPTGIVQQVSAEDPADIWYFRVQEMASPYEINVDYDQANDNELTIFINYRVVDYQGRYIGVTGIGLKVDTVRQVIGGYRHRYGQNVYFLNESGSITLYGEDGIGDRLQISSLRERIISKEHGSFTYEVGDETYLLNTRYIPELDWFLVVEQRESEGTAGFRRALFINMAICILVSTGVMVLFVQVVHAYQSRLVTMATTDKLTGKLNRQAMDVIVDKAIADAARTGDPLSVILFDIDHFKTINDRLGHLAGDQVIKAVADKIEAIVPASGSLCRWGGEEFLVLLHRCRISEAMAMAETIRISVCKLDMNLHVSVSSGVTEFCQSDTRDSFLARADEALYRAKTGGRNMTVQS